MEIVTAATPVDLAHIIYVAQPIVRARYDFVATGSARLSNFVDALVGRMAVQ